VKCLRTIDGILEAAMEACFPLGEPAKDSLRFSPRGSRSLGENLVEVAADALFVHGCVAVQALWTGRIVAIVERRRDEEGWKVRQIVEVE
jgi:hypothetical protein